MLVDLSIQPVSSIIRYKPELHFIDQQLSNLISIDIIIRTYMNICVPNINILLCNSYLLIQSYTIKHSRKAYKIQISSFVRCALRPNLQKRSHQLSFLVTFEGSPAFRASYLGPLCFAFLEPEEYRVISVKFPCNTSLRHMSSP